MMTDALLQLSSAQAVTATAVSTNTIDLGVARDIGQGQSLYVVIGVDEAATSAGATTVTFQVINSASAALSSPTILVQTDAIGKAELTLGRKPIVVQIPSAILNAQPVGQRYLGLQYTVATGPLTAGKFTATVTMEDPGVNKNYASGFTVF
jgi:hypothetical protein